MHDHEVLDDRNRGERRSRRRGGEMRMGVMAAGLVALGLSVAACSAGSTSPGVASVSSSPAVGQSSSAVSGKPSTLAYAQCMQSHGVKNFPEPNSSGQLTVTQGQSLPDPNSPQFQTAAKACASLHVGGVAPAQQAEQLQKDIAYAKCMRSHGVPNFPDPDPNTGDSFGLQGIDVNSSQVKSADKACGGNSSVGINQHNRTS
jgi:hypothetical protein